MLVSSVCWCVDNRTDARQIIENTFKPLVPAGQHLPPTLVPKLLHRFWSDEGYTLFPDVIPLLQKLRSHVKSTDGHMVVGVITNSDDRVPAILRSLGVRVASLRYGGDSTGARKNEDVDVDFSVMSYDVGHEKPDGRIFDAAVQMLQSAINAPERSAPGLPAASQWLKVYVGDDYDKDIRGAVQAGWHGVLIDREPNPKPRDLHWLDEQAPGALFDAFDDKTAVAFKSMASLAQWIPG